MDFTKDERFYPGQTRKGEFGVALGKGRPTKWRAVLFNGEITCKNGDVFEGRFFNYDYSKEPDENGYFGGFKLLGKVILFGRGNKKKEGEELKGVFEMWNTEKEYKYGRRICGVEEWEEMKKRGEVDEKLAWKSETFFFSPGDPACRQTKAAISCLGFAREKRMFLMSSKVWYAFDYRYGTYHNKVECQFFLRAVYCDA